MKRKVTGEEISNTEVRRLFHPNGQLKYEGTLINGLPHGIIRTWHPNGVLAKEWSRKNGIADGFDKQWNDKGELLGTSEFKNGTGISRSWYDNGILQGEITFVNGQFTGRQRVWFEDGEFVTEIFYIRGRKVSRKKYLEACKTDSTLPHYENEPKVESWESKMKRQQRVRKKPAATHIVETGKRLLDKFVSDATKCEAKKWLESAPKGITRTLGELPDLQESLALVDDAYSEGVSELFVVKVGSNEGFENTGTLLVQLPKSGRKRKNALAWCNEQNDFQGFDPEDDEGQEWMIVQLD